MPELPDVEIFMQYFDATSLHKKIVGMEAHHADMFSGITQAEVRKHCCGRHFAETVRTGKYLLARLDQQGWLVLHFGMTGYLKYFKKQEKAPGHIVLRFTFDNGYSLAYGCSRRLGRISWTDSPAEFCREKKLGSDPRSDSFDLERFEEILAGHHGAIKPLLMNQHSIAGIGNIYSDEILFHSGQHPKRGVDTLDGKMRRELFRNLESVLQTAIDLRVGERGWPDDWLLPHRRPGAACPRCGGEIVRQAVSGRNAYFCHHHQS